MTILLVLASAVAYAPCLRNGFVFDDDEYILFNPALKLGLIDAVKWAFTSFYAANWHPLTWISHFIDYKFFGFAPLGHHAVNLLFHLANSALLYRVLRIMTGTFWRSALVAAFFALHPLRVETVAWVSERKDLLSAFFFLLALGAYSRYARGPSWKRYLPVFTFFLFGLLAKPMIITLPFLFLLLDWWPFGRLSRGRGNGRNPAFVWTLPVLEKIPLVILSIVSGLLTLAAQKAGGAVKLLSLTVKLSHIPASYLAYLGKMFLPAGLAFFYPLRSSGVPGTQVVMALVVLVGFTAVAVACIRRWPWVTLGWFWYLGTLVPVIGLVQVGLQSMADRYSYLPLIGPFIIVAWGMAILASRSELKQLFIAVALTLLVVWGTVTFTQIAYWSSDYTLSKRALEVTSNNWLAHAMLGKKLHSMGSDEEALFHLRRAIMIFPEFSAAHYGLGVILANRGLFKDAIPHYERALRAKPDFTDAQVGLALCLARLGRLEDAVDHYKAALLLDADHEIARINLANNLDDLGRSGEAAAQYRDVLRRNPKNELAHFNLGLALKKEGRLAEARAEFAEALRIAPNYLEAQQQLAEFSSH